MGQNALSLNSTAIMQLESKNIRVLVSGLPLDGSKELKFSDLYWSFGLL